ncbi:hypothetical protein MLD38_021636 [Melastoma candidum]|uniref:Uncharacterized protein n=1 Tax=Melastoma candidum TaxID=119954 RepID=A0ACB9QGU7_9MYRT|nr:hypothetical protein MLD38_021636 [Melastoma candidum]
MGYSWSKLDIRSARCKEEKSARGVSRSGNGSSHRAGTQAKYLDNEISQITIMRSRPHENFIRQAPGERVGALPVSTVKMLAGREGNFSGRGKFSSADCCHILSRYLPVNGPWLMDQMNSRAYVSQFSADGSLFVAGFQKSHIKIYDVSQGWKFQRDILARNLRWTITDTSLSPDKRHLVYSSISPVVHIVNICSDATDSFANIADIHNGLDFSSDDDGGYAFGIFSVKFSTDGREIVAGSNDDAIHVYDLEANRLSLRISAHRSDVNTVCFANESGHLIFSGSDDTFCKVWDRRCLNAREKPAGVLIGHIEGITYIDSRGDGRYLISNGKDQAIKLWDIRTMSSNSNCGPVFKNYEWDYRWMDYPPRARELKHPRDQSVATYKGHSVLRTLIRCYFSPAHSTGQKYIYTGSHDSCVYIYDLLTGAQVAVLKHHKSPVRDCSWHPDLPMLVSSSWDGDIVKWEIPGDDESQRPAIKSRIRRRPVH